MPEIIEQPTQVPPTTSPEVTPPQPTPMQQVAPTPPEAPKESFFMRILDQILGKRVKPPAPKTTVNVTVQPTVPQATPQTPPQNKTI